MKTSSLMAPIGFIATFALGASGCTLQSESPVDREQGTTIVDGASASDPAYDAVGTIGDLLYETTYDPKCTATLIEPALVMTAAHCLRNYVASPVRKLVFAIGADAHAPAMMLALRGIVFDTPSTGGFGGLGRDVVFAKLEREVPLVRPIPLATLPKEESTVRAVGFGISDAKTRMAGFRLQGAASIRARQGAPLALIHGSLSALLKYVETQHGRDFVTRNRIDLEKQFHRTLEPGSELYVGGAKGEAQTCSGDSGSPLLMLQKGALTAVAVASFSYKGREGSVTCSSLGQVYSIPSEAAKLAARSTPKI